jgi:hypothetical protein
MRAEMTVSGYDSVLLVYSVCDDPGSLVACDDDSGPGYGSSLVKILDPGTYYVWVDSYSGGDVYDLDYSFRTDPCAGDPCPGTPECIASGDWTSYTCECPDGYLPWEDDCVLNPCIPNPCTEIEHKNKCVPELPVDYRCECNVGYIDDGLGGCMEDPDANEWAFIVFLNGDNNLGGYGLDQDDIDEMGQAGSTPYVHIVALWDKYGDGGENQARKVYVIENDYEVLEEVGEINMSDWQTMRDFGIWAVETYPARHYAFVAWDHGGGWFKGPKHPLFRGFSNDDYPGPGGGDSEILISNGDYAAALEGITMALGDKLDIVGHDECLMGMWEVAEATAPYAHYLVASEETEPGRGWAYHGFLVPLIETWTMSALELGQHICDSYHDEASDDVTLSVIDLDTMDALADEMTNFADTLMANPDLYGSVNSVRNATQSFAIGDNRDLKDFALGIAAMSGAPQELIDAANALIAQLDISIAYNRNQGGYSDAHGMAIYLPDRNSSVNPDYTDSGAVWSQRTTWDEFLQDFTQ